jgi:molecular chaperone DnaK (HSP70)
MYKPTIGIDFGSAYTKLAYRPAFPQQRDHKFAQQDTDVVEVEHSALIPSIVMYTGNRKKPWLVGREAAEVKPGSNWKIFRNWKSDIFSDHFQSRKTELHQVAVTFFSWLEKQVSSASLDINKKTRIRMSIPEMGESREQHSFLRNCMKESGWIGELEFVSEPIANAMGIFSGGRNYVSAEGKMSYLPMFSRHSRAELNCITEEIRAYLVHKLRAERYMKIMVVDCGGFTFDTAVLRLDLKVTDHSDLPFDVEYCESKDIGVIRQIDGVAFSELFKNHRIDENAVTYEAQELAKYDLYAGASHNIFVGDKIYNLGEADEDKEIVSTALNAYCESIWANLSKLNWKGMECVILTGGGSNIDHVQKYLKSRFKRKGVDRIIRFVETKSSSIVGSDNGLLFASKYSKSFGRVATALGDASIAFGFDI